jgi:hypothetical protein
MKATFLIATLLVFAPRLYAQSETVRLQVVSTETGTKEYIFKLPFGPPPTGDNSAVMKKVDAILAENKIDCPPKREKISENIWKCGNGKLVKTPDVRLGRILAKAWDEPRP